MTDIHECIDECIEPDDMLLADLLCVACGGEMNIATDSVIPLSPLWDGQQDICDGCHASLLATGDYSITYAPDYDHELNRAISNRNCDICGEHAPSGNRTIVRGVITDKRTNIVYGHWYGLVCNYCRIRRTING